MDLPLQQLETLVRARICSVCSDRTADGQCEFAADSPCVLFRLFPVVVRAVQSVESDDIAPYVTAIRRDVCSVCMCQAADGSCAARDNVACVLDSYLVLVVDAIESGTRKKTFHAA